MKKVTANIDYILKPNGSMLAGQQSAFSFGKNLSVFKGNVERKVMSFHKWFKFLKFIHKNQKTNSVDRHPPNSWNLFNMHGNVWEWCLDKSEGMHKIPEIFKEDIKNPVSSAGEEHF